MGDGTAAVDKDLERLVQLRTTVSDILPVGCDKDDYLRRWLRARNHDVGKAEAMLRSSLAWRKQIGADGLAENIDVPEVLKKYYPIGLVGHDKTGCPVWVVPFGNCDIKGLMQSAKKSDYVKYSVHLMEKSLKDMQDQSERLEMKIHQHVIVFDLENFGMRHISWKPGIDLMVYMAKLFSDNYPEVVKTIFVINAPKMFEIAYAIMKPFINEVTIRKVHMYGQDHWHDPLFATVDESEIPIHYGGTKNDGSGDPRCTTLMCLGGEVPQSYYMAPANRLEKATNLQTIVVNKSAKVWLEKDVTEPGATLKWEFKTESNDIGFGVFRTTEGDAMEELVPIQRVNCHLVPEDGQIIGLQPGKYKICFDNSYSRLRSKKVSYVLDVE